MNCYYHYRTIGGYTLVSLYDNLADLIKAVAAIAAGGVVPDALVLVYDYDYNNVAGAVLTHAFAGDPAVNAAVPDFVIDGPSLADANDTITLHQVEDWYANWKRTH